ncbi:hypothetical protein CLCR_00149 [Cladophialophora carrionii]|uniref:Uncharacterized protein n=1 Tax=Cladophialophora carrionii TaxID=86049 RepID=A0A1C1C695_9EURO|nr:hypothetical protein CLCR_00149 [Cladophialophora carrionii]
MAGFERQAAARELLGGEYAYDISVRDNTENSADSIFQTSPGVSGTATPVPGAQQTIQSNPMGAPSPRQIPTSTSPQYEVEELEDDLITALH